MGTVIEIVIFLVAVWGTLEISQVSLPGALEKGSGLGWIYGTGLGWVYALTVVLSVFCVGLSILFQPFFETVDPHISGPLWLRIIFYIGTLLVAANGFERLWWALKERHEKLTKRRNNEERLELAKVMAESSHI